MSIETVVRIVLALLAFGCLLAAVPWLVDVAFRTGRRLRRRVDARRPLPHRPAPDAPPQPGPRHRQADAHTASVSATEIRAALEEQSRRRQQTMHARAQEDSR